MLQKAIQIIIVGCLSKMKKMKNGSIIFILLAVFTSSAYAQDSLANNKQSLMP